MAQQTVKTSECVYASIRQLSPAQVEEEKLMLLDEMCDRLVHEHGLTEAQATASVNAFMCVAAAVEPTEVVSVVRYLRRIERMRRDQRIRADLRTGNAAEIARREGVSQPRVYQIAAERSL